MILSNSLSDVARGIAVDSSPVWGYVVDGRLDPDKLKTALEQVFRHFPVLTARMQQDKETLIILDNVEPFAWTVVEHQGPLSAVFSLPLQSQVISVNKFDIRGRADFYVPHATTVVRRPGVADEKSPLVEIHVQRFTDKTVIGITWNHLLTDGSGMSIVIDAWTKALRHEPLPQEIASYIPPFKSHYTKNPTLPAGSINPLAQEKGANDLNKASSSSSQNSPAEPRSIFIPKSVLATWKAESEGVSTNDLITAWLLKSWASTLKPIRSFNIGTVFDLRKRLPIVPETYLRNATSVRASIRPFTAEEVLKMSHLDAAKMVRECVACFTPETEINYQSYQQKYCPGGFGLWPSCSTMFTLSSWSKFNLPQMDFGGKTESFEGFTRLNRQYGNVGTVWLEDGGARINWWMSKKKWNKGVWKTMSEDTSYINERQNGAIEKSI
jgi:hypothetical protein